MRRRVLQFMFLSIVPVLGLITLTSACNPEEESLVLCDFGEGPPIQVPAASCDGGTIVGSQTGPVFEP